MAKLVYGVFTQYEPTYKYEEALKSIWSTKEKAEDESKLLKSQYDHVRIQEMYVDSDCYWMNPDESS